MAGLGVQVLFGFLLSLPFTTRFSRLSHGQRELYLASLVLAAVSTALLVGPVAYHRLVFRRGTEGAPGAGGQRDGGARPRRRGPGRLVAVLLVSSYVATALPAALITVFIVLPIRRALVRVPARAPPPVTAGSVKGSSKRARRRRWSVAHGPGPGQAEPTAELRPGEMITASARRSRRLAATHLRRGQ